MRIDFALFGERNGAHELLSTTLLDSSLARAIRGKTDKPSYVPPGFELSPSIFGFSNGSNYILGRTFSDPGASRGGMVATVALFVNLGEISRCDNLDSIFSLLPSSKPPSCPDPLEVTLENTEEPRSQVGVSRPLLEALIASGMTRPVAWIGVGFDEELGPLWRSLWPNLRRNFGFRQAFDPQDLSVDQPTIVLVPESVRSRWSDFPLVQKNSVALVTVAGDALLNVGAGRDVRELLAKLDIKEPKIRDLIALANVADNFREKAPAVDQLRSALHIVGRLCPNPSAGKDVKSKILAKISSVIPHVIEVAEIKAFRNVDLRPYADPAPLMAAVSIWTSEHLLDDRTGFVASVFDHGSTISPALRAGAIRALRSSDRRRMQDALQLWLVNHGASRLDLLELSLDADLSDAELARFRWDFAKCEVDELLSSNRLAQKPLATIAIAAASLPLKEALVVLQLWEAKVDDPRLQSFLNYVERKVYYRSCLEEHFPCALAAACILADSAVIEHEQPVDTYGAEALALAITAGLDSLEVPEDALKMAATASLEIGSSVMTTRVLWRALTERNISILNQSDRATYWSRIPDPYRVALLNQTAAEWVQALENGNAEGPPENALSDAVWTRVRRGGVSMPSLLWLFKELPGLNEQTFTAAVLNRDRGSTLDRFSAEVLGDIVEQRRWRQAAEQLLSEAWHDAELRPAVSLCSSQLGRLQRLRVRFLLPSANHTPSIDELWDATEELALELYQWGPGDHNVWERAGGDPSLMKSASTGSESWHHVLSSARNGGGDVDLRSLLNAMTREFWNNDVLQKLLEYAKHVDR